MHTHIVTAAFGLNEAPRTQALSRAASALSNQSSRVSTVLGIFSLPPAPRHDPENDHRSTHELDFGAGG